MTYEQILKEFDECWYRDDVKRGLYEGKIDKEWFKSFLKQSFIKYLQAECERLEQLKLTPKHKGGYEVTVCGITNQVISDQITHINNQIKELESIKN